MEEKLYQIGEAEPAPAVDNTLPLVLTPQDDRVFEEQTAIPYTTTLPADSPRISGVRRIYYDGTNYWFYIYANGGWRSQQLIGLTFPTDDPGADRGLFWDDSAGKLAWFSVSGGLSFSGTVLSVATDQVVENYTKADSAIAAGDVVSLLEGGSTDFWLQDIAGAVAEVGKQANPNRAAVKFTAPLGIIGFSATVWLREIGTSTSDVDVVLYSDNAGVPNSAIETQTIDDTLISGTFAQFSVTFTSALTAGTTYWIAIQKQGAVDAANYYTTKVADSFTMYSAGATFDSAAWASNTAPIAIVLNKTLTAGLYRSIDVPNNCGIQGSIKGIAKTVNSGDVDVVISGKYTSSGTPYTAGNDYFLSTSTAGGVSASGQCLLGRAVSTSLIDIFSHKKCCIRVAGVIQIAASPTTVTIMSGVRANRLECQAGETSQYMSIGSWSNSSEKSIKWKDGTAPAIKGSLWDTENSGGGSAGSRDTSLTVNKSSIAVAITSTAASLTFTGYIDFIY